MFLTDIKRLKINFLGDSITEGGGASDPAVKGYVGVIAECYAPVAAKYAIPALDLYNESGICPDVEANKLTYTADGLHPNDFGHSCLADKVAGFIKSL